MRRMRSMLIAVLALMVVPGLAYAVPNTVAGDDTIVRLGKRPVIETSGSCKTVRVIDGDTVLCGKTRVRAADYDTAEILGKCSDPYEQASLRKAAADQALLLESLISRPHRFGLRYVKGKDEFGRSIARFYSDGKSVAPAMITAGAHPYKRSTGRTPWCQ